MNALALVLEEGMLTHPRTDDQITAGPAVGAGTPLTGKTDLHARVHPGGNRGRHRLVGAADTAAPAEPAGPSIENTTRPADGARRIPRHVESQCHTVRGVGERQIDGDMHVVAATIGLQRARPDLRAVTVVHRTRRGIVEDAVRFRNLVEE